RGARSEPRLLAQRDQLLACDSARGRPRLHRRLRIPLRLRRKIRLEPAPERLVHLAHNSDRLAQKLREEPPTVTRLAHETEPSSSPHAKELPHKQPPSPMR